MNRLWLTDQTIEQALVSICSKGPSFVPTPTSVDWNAVQKSWLDFKRKVRWRSFFHGREVTSTCGDENPLEAPYKKSVKEPPLSVEDSSNSGIFKQCREGLV
jgi:hypothetical protein